MTTRSEQMGDFDCSEDARYHRQYIADLRTLRDRVRLRTNVRVTTLARDRVVRAIDKLIAEAERAEA